MALTLNVLLGDLLTKNDHALMVSKPEAECALLFLFGNRSFAVLLEIPQFRTE